jgi:hypothetical protein
LHCDFADLVLVPLLIYYMITQQFSNKVTNQVAEV